MMPSLAKRGLNLLSLIPLVFFAIGITGSAASAAASDRGWLAARLSPDLSAADAAAARSALYADLPDLSTPQVAYDRSQIQPKGVAVRGANGVLLYSALSGSSFAPFQSLGATIVGDPSAVVTPQGTELFFRGIDDRVYTVIVTPSGAATGVSAVSGLTVTGEVESVVPLPEGPADSVRLFARGVDGAVWTNIRRDGSWSGWSSLGGFITSDITASRLLNAGGIVRIYVRGSDNRVYYNDLQLNNVSGFKAVDDFRVTSNIAVLEGGALNGLMIYARGVDNIVYIRSLPHVQGTWQPRPGVSVTSDIAVTFEALYVRGPDNAIYTSRRAGTSFLPFERVEGQVTGNPAAFTLSPVGPAQNQYLLGRQPNGALGYNIRPFSGGTPGGFFPGYILIPGPAIG
jgi:hypothetical protein